VTVLIPGRGVLGTEYADELLVKIENSNCRKGCIHAVQEEFYIDCGLGLLVAVCLSEGKPVPEFELHGNRYITCLRRRPPEPAEPEPPIDPGPDLFEATS
jgi:hypothetical protein